MKTGKKTMAEIYRRMADNLDNWRNCYDGLQFFNNGQWRNMVNGSFSPEWVYRIKPKTITVNGVEIPEPLDIKDLDSNTDYYTPFLCSDLYYAFIGFFFRSKGIKIAYETKEEAIEASKKLFGIE